VTTISETRYLTTRTTTTLFGKLREHVSEMTRLKEMETVEKKSRSLALKTKATNVELRKALMSAVILKISIC